MKRKPKAAPGSLTITLTPLPAPDKPGYWWLHDPWNSVSAPVEVREWSTGWQVFRIGSLYPLRSSQHYDRTTTWYWLGELLEMVTAREAHDTEAA